MRRASILVLSVLLVAVAAVQNDRDNNKDKDRSSALASDKSTAEPKQHMGMISGNVRMLSEGLGKAFKEKDPAFFETHINDDSLFVFNGELPGSGLFKGKQGFRNMLYDKLLNVKVSGDDIKFDVLAADEGRQSSIVQTTFSPTFARSGKSAKDAKVLHFIEWNQGVIKRVVIVPDDYAVLRNAFFTDNEMVALNFTDNLLLCGECSAKYLSDDVSLEAPGLYPPGLQSLFSFKGKDQLANYLKNNTWFANRLASTKIILSQDDTVITEDQFASHPIIPIVAEVLKSVSSAGSILEGGQSTLQPFKVYTVSTIKDGRISRMQIRSAQPLSAISLKELVHRDIATPKAAQAIKSNATSTEKGHRAARRSESKEDIDRDSD